MIESTDTILSKLRLLSFGFGVVASLLMLTFIISEGVANNAQARSSGYSHTSMASDMTGSPNAITRGLGSSIDKLGQSVDSTALAVNSSMRSFASATVRSSKAISHSAATNITPAARGIGNGVALAGHTATSGVVSVLQVPGKVAGFISDTTPISAFIKPSHQVEVPIIDPSSPELLAAIAAMPPTAAANQQTPQANAGPIWPIHGEVTTEFGVRHWPYQRVHTGMDISSPNPSGVTPVKPFRPGRVIDTVLSRQGLGNHVIIDHGNGLTSVYAHLASISVKVGQDVDTSTVVGMEGSTGVSTGTHLHFEIRVNGKAADPRQFISGQP